MSRLKKIFIAVSAAIMVLTASFVITICNKKINVGIAFDSPYSVIVHNYTYNGTEYKSEDVLEDFGKEFNNLTNLSIYTKLINSVSLSKKISMDSEGKFSKWNTDMMNNNLVIEIIYTNEHDLLVYDNGKSRIISYVCLSFVIPKTTDFTEIAVYYATTSNTQDNEKNNSYSSYTPLVLHGDAEDLLKLVESLEKNA